MLFQKYYNYLIVLAKEGLFILRWSNNLWYERDKT